MLVLDDSAADMQIPNFLCGLTMIPAQVSGSQTMTKETEAVKTDAMNIPLLHEQTMLMS